MNRTVWKVGHVLSRKGLIDAACQMRDAANSWSEDNDAARSEALGIVDRLYRTDSFIDESTWRELRDRIQKA